MIAVTSSGRSFRALATYLRRGRSGEEWDRVAWTSARNLPTDDPELAAKLMRATADQNTRVHVPVYHLAISFDTADVVTRTQMEQVADAVLRRLGLAEHQTLLVAHRDRAHAHVHVLVNRVHPETGKAWERWKDRPVIERVLREQEVALGLRQVNGRLAPVPGREVPDPIAVEGWTSGEQRQRARGEPGDTVFIERVRALVPQLRTAVTWAEWESVLTENGLSATPKGQGLVITDGIHYVKASRIGREQSRRALEHRFGVGYGDRHTFGCQGPHAHIEAVAVAIRQYAQTTRLTQQHYEMTIRADIHQAHVGLAAPTSVSSRAALDDARIARRHARQLDAMRQGVPTLATLQRAIAEGMDRLSPPELQRLKTLVTDPQLALATRVQQWVRQELRELVVGRDEPPGRGV